MTLTFRTKLGCFAARSGLRPIYRVKFLRSLVQAEFSEACIEGRVRIFCRLSKVWNDVQHFLRWFRHAGIGKPQLCRIFENRDGVDRLVQAIDHAVRAKLIRRNLLQSDSDLTQDSCSRAACAIEGLLSSMLSMLVDFVYAAVQLKVRSIHESGDSLCSSLQCPKVCFINQLGSCAVLSAHDKNCYSQCSDRSERLYPSRPVRFAQLLVKASNNQRGNYGQRQQHVTHKAGFQESEINCHMEIIS